MNERLFLLIEMDKHEGVERKSLLIDKSWGAVFNIYGIYLFML